MIKDNKCLFPTKVALMVEETMTHLLKYLPQGGKVKDLPEHAVFRFRVVAWGLRDKYIREGLGDKD